MQKEFQFLNDNLTEIVQTINISNNEVWFRQFPVDSLLSSCHVLSFDENLVEKNIKKIKQAVVYINIPFCNNQCDYCGLKGARGINTQRSFLYVECLKKEIDFLLRDRADNKIKILAVLIGGGTPSLLSPVDMEDLLIYLNQKFEIEKETQISIEVSPSDISKKMAKALAKGGVNRVCIGVQSFNEKKLKQCGRRLQKVEHVYEATKNLRNAGINNIGLDLIFGLEEKETSKDFLKDNLRHIEKIKPQNVDFYSMQDHVKYPKNIRSFYSSEFEKAKKKVITKLLEWSKRDKFNFSRYFWLRRCRNINCISIGAGGKSDFWIDGRYIGKINKNNRDNPLGYIKDIENNLFKYEYAMLNEERSVRKFIIHNLNLDTGLDRRVLKHVFPSSKSIIDRIFLKIKDKIIETGDMIKLREDFEEFLPFKTKNRNTNYFIFSFCFLYLDKDRKTLIKSFKSFK